MKELMILVERAVRPVRASRRRKSRMREEMLAHVNEIHKQELERQNDSDAALCETARRFGSPAELTRDLQASVGWDERLSYATERWCAWRAGESAARYTLRQALTLLLFNLTCLLLILVAIVMLDGPIADISQLLRPALAMIVICSASVFLHGLLHFKIRDAMLGPPWVGKSWLLAGTYGLLFAVTVYGAGLIFAVFALWDEPTINLLDPMLAIVALIMPVLFGVVAWVQGPAQIRHVEWAMLDIG